jgi:hypothetical protein
VQWRGHTGVGQLKRVGLHSEIADGHRGRIARSGGIDGNRVVAGVGNEVQPVARGRRGTPRPVGARLPFAGAVGPTVGGLYCAGGHRQGRLYH